MGRMPCSEIGICPIVGSARRGQKTFIVAYLFMKEFIGQIRYRLPDDEGHAQFLFAHSSGALLKVMIKPGVPLPDDRQPVLVLGDLVGSRINAHEIILWDLADEMS